MLTIAELIAKLDRIGELGYALITGEGDHEGAGEEWARLRGEVGYVLRHLLMRAHHAEMLGFNLPVTDFLKDAIASCEPDTHALTPKLVLLDGEGEHPVRVTLEYDGSIDAIPVARHLAAKG